MDSLWFEGPTGKRRIGRCFIALAAACLTVLPSCAGKKEEKLPPPPMQVGVLTIDRGNIEQTLNVSGTLHYVANTTVSSEVAAQVKSLEVSDGQPVAAGQLLLVFDETKIQATADQALGNLQKNEATLQFNKTDWEKAIELFKTGAVSQTQYDQKYSLYRTSVGQVEADKAALAKAREDLKKTKVLAPIAGLLSDRYVEKGDWVSEGGKLFQLSDFSRIRLEAFLSDIDLGRLNVKNILTEGVEGEVTVDSYPGEVFKGNLSYIQPVANQSRLFQIRMYLENPDMRLLQGMFARGRIVVKTIPNVLRVPLSALLEQIRENDTNTVFLVDEAGKAKLTRIKIGRTDADYAEISEGPAEGDTVVIQGKEILSTGQPLKPLPAVRPTRTGSSPPKPVPDKPGGDKPAGPENSTQGNKSR